MSKSKFSNEQLIALLKSDLSFKEIVNSIGASPVAIARRMKQLNVSTFNFKLDENIFDCIDSEEKAYWLGFLFADGYIAKERPRIELSLKSDDEEHLIKFINFLKHKRANISHGKISLNGKIYHSCKYSVQNKNIYEHLIKYGCVPQKSLTLKFPDKNIFKNENLIYDFIRGYIDGDGCIWFNKKMMITLEIMGTHEFLEQIQNIFPQMTLGHKDKRRPNSNTYRLIACANNAIDILNKVYGNATVYLDRKYKRYKFAVS